MNEIFDKKKEKKVRNKNIDSSLNDSSDDINKKEIDIDNVVSTGSLESISCSNEKCGHPEAHEIDDEQKQGQTKTILLFLLGIIVIIGLLVLLGNMYNLFYNEQPLNHNDMHELNMQGKLGSDRGYFYNGLSFVFFNALWNTEIQYKNTIYDLGLHYGPREVENVSLHGSIDDMFILENEYYVVFNPHDANLQNTNVGISELLFGLVNVIKKHPRAICSQNHTSCVGVPIFNCSNNQNDPIIQFETTDKDAEVFLDGNCVYLRGREKEIIRATNRLLWWWYNVMEN